MSIAVAPSLSPSAQGAIRRARPSHPASCSRLRRPPVSTLQILLHRLNTPVVSVCKPEVRRTRAALEAGRARHSLRQESAPFLVVFNLSLISRLNPADRADPSMASPRSPGIFQSLVCFQFPRIYRPFPRGSAARSVDPRVARHSPPRGWPFWQGLVFFLNGLFYINLICNKKAFNSGKTVLENK